MFFVSFVVQFFVNFVVREHIMLSMKPVLAALFVVVLSFSGFAQTAAKIDVTGKWAFQVDTDQGSGTPTIEFKQEGEKLTGRYIGQFGQADLSGTVKGQNIDFSFTVDIQGNAIQEHYAGTVESKDSMKGKVELVGVAQGTFTAKRQ